MYDTNSPPLLQFRGVFGIPVQIVPSFLMLAAVFVLFDPSIRGVGFFALIALSILLHEFGHAWGARVQGVPVRRVVLWGGGGLCYHAGTPDPRKRELIVAMGPLVNLALWAVASLASDWLYLQMDSGALGMSEALWELAWQLNLLAWINLTLFALNLLPVSPLDGGTLLYLVLRRATTADRAARVAGSLGVVIAVAWIPAMIYVFLTWGWLLFFIPSIRLHLDMAKGRVRP